MAGTSTGLFILTVPILSGSDVATGEFYIPVPVISGRSGISFDVFTLPTPVITGASISRSHQVEIVIPTPVISGSILRGTLGTGSFILPGVIITGASQTGSRGTFVLPSFVVTDITPQHSRGTYTLPTFGYEGFGHGIPLSKVYRGVVANLLNEAISTYGNFNANSLAYFDGKYLLANEQGIFVIGDRKDTGRDINFKIKSGQLDFGGNFIKNLRNVWLTHSTDGHLLLTIEVGNTRVDCQRTEIVGTKVEEERIKVPRGLKSRFYTIELKNISGADMDLDTISIMVEAIRRKLR